MALFKSVRGFTPVYGQNCFFAENATIIGDVVMGSGCSVWFQAVLRGDVNSIRIGNDCNIQDGVIVHGTYERAATTIGDRVSVGHGAVIHGATIQDDVLVGINAVILDNAIINSEVIIAAGAIVLANTICESGYIYAGAPAKKIKKISPDMSKDYLERISKNYHLYASWFEEE